MIAGVDYSTKEIHLVRRVDGQVDSQWRQIKLVSRMEFAERDAIIARDVGKVMLAEVGWWDDVWLCGIEYPFTDAAYMNSLVLKTILGSLSATIPEHVHVIPLPARLWQPWFLRKHRSDPLPKMPRKGVERKPLIRAHALEMLGSDDIWPQDAYDAFGLSVAVERYNRPAMNRPQPQAVRIP